MKKNIILGLVITLVYFSILNAGYNVDKSAVFSASVFVKEKSGQFIHTPISRYNIVNDQIVLKVNFTGTSKYTNIILHYRIGGESAYKEVEFQPKIKTNISSYEGIAIIPANEVTDKGIEYYIESKSVSSNVDEWMFKTALSPQQVLYFSSENIKYSKPVEIELKDGNIYDGVCKLKIDNYDSGDTISFSQINDISSLPANNNKGVLNDKPIAAYKIEPSDKMLTTPAGLSLLYFDINQDGYEDIGKFKESVLQIYRYDGFEWCNLGGEVDNVANIIKLDIYSFGIFGIFPVESKESMDYRPKERILTLDGNGQNDYLIFNGLRGEYEIRIIDISGRLVRLIKNLPYWDGKDSDGNTVPSGVYMYELKKDSKIIKGIFVVAK